MLETAEKRLTLPHEAPVEHLLCHAAELLMKAAVRVCDPGRSISDFGHHLERLYRALEKSETFRPILASVEAKANGRLGAVPRDILTADEGVQRLPIEADDGVTEPPPMPTNGEDAHVSALALMEWYGERHASDGGWFRYPKTRLETQPFLWSANGQTLLLPLAMMEWVTAFRDALWPHVLSSRVRS